MLRPALFLLALLATSVSCSLFLSPAPAAAEGEGDGEGERGEGGEGEGEGEEGDGEGEGEDDPVEGEGEEGEGEEGEGEVEVNCDDDGDCGGFCGGGHCNVDHRCDTSTGSPCDTERGQLCNEARRLCGTCAELCPDNDDNRCNGGAPVCDANGSCLDAPRPACPVERPVCLPNSGDCVECANDGDCDDGDDCTLDSCLGGGFCAHIGVGDCEDCDDDICGGDERGPSCVNGECGCGLAGFCGDEEVCVDAVCHRRCDNDKECLTGQCNRDGVCDDP